MNHDPMVARVKGMAITQYSQKLLATDHENACSLVLGVNWKNCMPKIALVGISLLAVK